MDGKNALMIMGMTLLFLAGFGWPVVAAGYMEKKEREKRNEPPRFDERQNLARQRAGNHALYVLIGFLVAWACVDLGGWFEWTGSGLDLVLCALPLTWGVWTADCLLHDAFSGWKEKNASDAISITISIFIMNFINSFRAGGFLKSRTPCYLAFGIVLFLGGVILYKRVFWSRLANEEEDGAP